MVELDKTPSSVGDDVGSICFECFHFKEDKGIFNATWKFVISFISKKWKTSKKKKGNYNEHNSNGEHKHHNDAGEHLNDDKNRSHNEENYQCH